ncbi:hypothetical protein O181_014071 [Austropuccinia psidii MF-1]|uniref:Uncharacterized protein n=1 Tax=Austropuccinia psidii MF-1 TaxID=1389203 RepID=A0A9Q3GNU0_9BASI|nr:hypothetical protein [Austropuccinia psidii MF-1]
MRKNRLAFAIGEEPLGEIRGQDLKLCLDVERNLSTHSEKTSISRSVETRKEIEKHINEFLHMDLISKIGHNEIVELTTPFLITWNYGKSGLCGDFRALNNYTKSDSYSIPRIPHAQDNLVKSQVYNQNGLYGRFSS